MELRSTERDVTELASSYDALQRESLHVVKLHDLELPPLAIIVPTKNDDTSQNQWTLPALLTTLQSIHGRVVALTPKIERFRKRLQEKDAVTEKPRYGESTARRVKNMLSLFEHLVRALQLLFGDLENDNGSSSSSVISKLRSFVESERRSEEQAKKELAAREAEERKKQLEREKQAMLETRKREEALRQEKQQLADELAQRAQQSRDARRQAEQERLEHDRLVREENERADREWVASIGKGPDGVRQQLARIKESMEADGFGVVLNALHTLFSQIVSHPEEVKFKRVRRDHEKFNEDIGRHPGGKELLIAAGFRLGSIDDVPCFISTEPNIENDMDGWSSWFDLLKATLDILEEELQKC